MSERRRTRRTTEKDWERVLLALSRTGNVCRACKIANVGRTAFYERRKNDKDFAAKAAEAVDLSCDVLESEAWRRGSDGLVRKKFTAKGEPIIDPETGEQYVEREYSDTLLIFLLKANRPDKFRENVRHQHEHSGEVSVTIEDIAEAKRNAKEGLERWNSERASGAN